MAIMLVLVAIALLLMAFAICSSDIVAPLIVSVVFAVAVELAEPISGLPAPEFDLAPFDAARAIDLASPDNGAVLPVPSLSALKTHIKASRAELKAAGKKSDFVLLDLGAEFPLMSANLMADILEIIPDAKFTASSRNPQLAAVYFEGASGRGCVLPVRRKPSSAA